MSECPKCNRIHTVEEYQAMNPFERHLHRPIEHIPGAKTWEQIQAENKRDDQIRDSVKIAPRGKRPRCIYCTRELRPYPHRHPSDPTKLYGTYGDNRFCGLTCGWKYAVRTTKNPIPRQMTKKISGV